MSGRSLAFVASACLLTAAASEPAKAAPAGVTTSDRDCYIRMSAQSRRDYVRSFRRASSEARSRRFGGSARSSVAVSSSSGGSGSVAASASSNGRARSTILTRNNHGCSVVVDEELRKGAPR